MFVNSIRVNLPVRGFATMALSVNFNLKSRVQMFAMSAFASDSSESNIFTLTANVMKGNKGKYIVLSFSHHNNVTSQTSEGIKTEPKTFYSAETSCF